MARRRIATRDELAFLETDATIADNAAFRARVSAIVQEVMTGFERGHIARVITNYDAYRANPNYPTRVKQLIACLHYELDMLSDDTLHWYDNHL